MHTKVMFSLMFSRENIIININITAIIIIIIIIIIGSENSNIKCMLLMSKLLSESLANYK